MTFSKQFGSSLISLLILAATSFSVLADTSDTASTLEWIVEKQWQLSATPIDIAHSLDNKYVFVLAEDQKVYVYNSAGKHEGAIPVDPGVTAIDIAPRAEKLYLINDKTKTFTALSIDFIRNINTAGSPYLGPEDAPITVALFTDFECPYCRKIEPLMAEVHKRNPETVKIVFKNMPLQFHKFADPAARAALAAENQGKFWEFHDELFAVEEITMEAISNIATKLNLDLEKWKRDMVSQEVRQKIYRDMQDAQKAGVTGTPTIFVNGRLLKNRSLQGFQQLIDKELQN
ncbi:MAG: thioredoxin domain-containing protein [Desulfocapsaceae bacterium]|nr:thioredoxin domain-containing protein [Desulfocapsaceae bacterium]